VLRHACGCRLKPLSVCCQLNVLLQQADVLVPQVLRLLVQEGQLILQGASKKQRNKIQSAGHAYHPTGYLATVTGLTTR
jgi:hypothetical protein